MDRLTAIQKLFAAYPNTTASTATFAVYLEVFDGVSVEELHATVMQCIREGGSFPPSAGQVFERWRNMHSPVSPDLAAQGWLSVQRAMRDPATYSPTPEGPSPKFCDPLVAKAVEALGWHNLRLSENPMADRAQFLKFYQMFANSEVGEQRLSPEFKQLREDNKRAVEELSLKQEREGFPNLKRIGAILNGTIGGES